MKLCTLSFSKRGNPKKKGRKKVLECSIGKGVSGAPYTYSIVIIYHYAIGKLWLPTCTRNKILAVTNFYFKNNRVMDNCQKSRVNCHFVHEGRRYVLMKEGTNFNGEEGKGVKMF